MTIAIAAAKGASWENWACLVPVPNDWILLGLALVGIAAFTVTTVCLRKEK